MNQQLTLIEIEALEATAGKTRNTRKRESSKSNKLTTQAAAQAWWKLSSEEKQQGLAGVRAIRAILQSTAMDSPERLARAS